MSNLPPPAFQPNASYNATVDIDAPIEAVWAILTDLSSYPLWNPCHRSAIMVDPTTLKPTADTTLRAGGVVQLAMVTPADVNSKKNPTVVNEHVTKVDPASHQIVWGGGRLPTLFRAELAQALSTTPDGKTRYENRHVFSGVSGHVIRTFMGKTMQDAAQATADALKQRAEGQHA